MRYIAAYALIVYGFWSYHTNTDARKQIDAGIDVISGLAHQVTTW